MTYALLATLLMPTCGVAREFPIGLYGVPSNAPLAALGEAGFTHVLPASASPEDQERLAKAVRKAGLRFIGIPQPLIHSQPGRFPVSAWYVSDEPDVNHESPEEISTQAARIRRWDPGTPLVLVVGAGARAAEYADSVDSLMVDWYPVPHLPLTGVGDEVSAAVSKVSAKPVWAVLQAMDWRDYPQGNPEKPRIGRFPTRNEIRFMAYHAILRGASGLFFFELRKRSFDGATLLDAPEHWQALRSVTKELSEIKTFLESSPGKPLRLAGLEAMSWRRHGRELVVLLNPSATPQPIPTEFRSPAYALIFESALRVGNALPLGLLDSNRVIVLTRRSPWSG